MIPTSITKDQCLKRAALTLRRWGTTCLLSATALGATAQTQLGDDIDGEGKGDRAGWSVAFSAGGDTVAVGAPSNLSFGFVAGGHARVFAWDGIDWVQVGLDIEAVSSAENAGQSVALSADGRRLAVGAPTNDNNGLNTGQARVYELGTNSDGLPAWTLLGAPIDGEDAGRLGSSVSLSADGNRLAVGAPFSGTFQGYAQVYDWNGTAWTKVGDDFSDNIIFGGFGSNVSLSADGNRLLINGADPQAYAWNGTTWETLGEPLPGPCLNLTLSADGNTLAFAPVQNGDNPETDPPVSTVRVLTWDGSAWTAQGESLGELITGPTLTLNAIGLALSADGQQVAVGIPFPLPGQSEQLRTQVYTWDGDSWEPEGNEIEDEAPGDGTGFSLALSADGSRLAVGALFAEGVNPIDPNNPIDSTGNVRVFQMGPATHLATAAANVWSVYPNPARGQLHVTVAEHRRTTATLCDPLGRVCHRAVLPPGGGTIDVRSLPAGLYLLTLQNDQTRYVERVLLR